MTEVPAWERSVEKARLALLKTFEGRVEAALASIEQIPFGPGRKGKSESTLAEFCLDAGIEYKTLREYRDVTQWLGQQKAGDPAFSEETARYRVGDIGTWSIASEAIRGHKWATGTLFAAFLDANTPPAPFKKWTVDALRVHLGHKPTNTGTLALKAAAGEDITKDDERKASALDHAQEAADDLKEIESTLTREAAGVEARAAIREAAPFTGGEFAMIKHEVEDMFGPIQHAHHLAREFVQAVKDSAIWLEKHGDRIVGGDTNDADDRPEKIADIARDGFAEDLGLITAALTEVGVGESITEGFNSLLNG